jgi:hypothetical protein
VLAEPLGVHQRQPAVSADCGNGVLDLRNLPANRGFNTCVRTTDAQDAGQRAARNLSALSALPPGITAWRVDAGFQREDFFTRSTSYGAPVVVGSYATGINHDLLAATNGRVTRLPLGWTRRHHHTLWAGHIGAQWCNQRRKPAAPGHPAANGRSRSPAAGRRRPMCEKRVL